MSKIAGNILAFDFGLSRIGVALANSILQIPHPLAIIHAKDNKLAQIASLIKKWQPVLLLVGVPGESNITVMAKQKLQKEMLLKKIIEFSDYLKETFKLEVLLINEDYSSVAASSKLEEQEIRGYYQKGKIDALAACAILEYFFSEHQDVI